MRRLVALAALLLLLSLTSVFAASFTVDAEDIASFTTSVSISVPEEPPGPQPPNIYLIGEGLTTELNHDITADDVALGPDEVEAELVPGELIEWQTNTNPETLTVSNRPVYLQLYTTSGAAKLGIGLFKCATAATATAACTPLTATEFASASNGVHTLQFPDQLPPTEVFTFSISAAETLRLQIKNVALPSATGNSARRKLQWSKAQPTRDSGLVFAVAPTSP